MVTYCAELEDFALSALGKDKFFYQAWLKYAKSVSDTEDVFDYMLEKKIGADFASVYITISTYIEEKAKDLRKAELTLRNGITHLASKDELKKELARVEREYANFEKRVHHDHTKKVRKVLIQKVDKIDHKNRRNHLDYKALQKQNERELDRL